jgi:hypothetical protein
VYISDDVVLNKHTGVTMKIFYSFLIVLNAIAVSFSAQQQKKSFGIKFGPYFSTIRYSVKSDNDNQIHTFDTKANPSVSFNLYLPQTKTIVHSLALHYYQNSGKEYLSNSWLSLSSFSRTIKLQYLGMGYNFKANLPIEPVIPYFIGGITFDFLTNYEWKGNFGNDEIYRIDDEDINHFTARAILGGGVEYSFDRVSVLLEYCFSYNLIPFYSWKSDNGSTRYNYTAYGSTFNFGVKIPF